MKPVRVVLVVPYWDKCDEIDGVELICLLKKKKFCFLLGPAECPRLQRPIDGSTVRKTGRKAARDGGKGGSE
ncbi:hypothetical protein CYMTET_52782 [Cymbomonas tetramitiformis]|uniref:Uncharacterized protein n=1 Tax=Cymbomonas tetramitiformis TaxID=36881 RepID=A0AAE0BIB8_9CHLO|nr:hypothetical protein CYMTET_52782 [Cymbomonas tetramitiformis]